MIEHYTRRHPGCGILVMGSVQRGEEDAASDLDLFVLVPGDGAIVLAQEQSPEGVAVDAVIIPEGAFLRTVAGQWYQFWLLAQAAPVHDPTGIAQRSQAVVNLWSAADTFYEPVWRKQLAELRQAKADRRHVMQYPHWAEFSRHLDQLSATREIAV
jgi:hypothetical protein